MSVEVANTGAERIGLARLRRLFIGLSGPVLGVAWQYAAETWFINFVLAAAVVGLATARIYALRDGPAVRRLREKIGMFSLGMEVAVFLGPMIILLYKVSITAVMVVMVVFTVLYVIVLPMLLQSNRLAAQPARPHTKTVAFWGTLLGEAGLIFLFFTLQAEKNAEALGGPWHMGELFFWPLFTAVFAILFYRPVVLWRQLSMNEPNHFWDDWFVLFGAFLGFSLAGPGLSLM